MLSISKNKRSGVDIPVRDSLIVASPGNYRKKLSNYFPALTGVRALAAYLVFISHYAYSFDAGLPKGIKRFLEEFHIGVGIFFVLSGFLITYRYYDNFELNTTWFRKYIKNRITRIYPMYFILTVCTFIYFYYVGFKIAEHAATPSISGKTHPIWLFLANITLFKGFFNTFKFSGIGPGWSLTVEECFYLSAPFIFMVLKKYKLFYLQALLITVLGFLLVLVFRNVNWYGFFGNFTFMMIYTFFGRCFEFFIGIQLALMFKKKGKVASTNINLTYNGFILIFICPFIMSLLTIPHGWTAGLNNPWGIVTNNYLLPLAIAIFFYGLLTESTILKRILAHPFSDLLGKSSYIFYLIHLGFIAKLLQAGIEQLNDMVFRLYDNLNLDWHSPFEYDPLNIFYLFIALNAISIVLFKLIEEPLNHYIRRSNFLVKAE